MSQYTKRFRHLKQTDGIRFAMAFAIDHGYMLVGYGWEPAKVADGDTLVLHFDLALAWGHR